MKLRSGKQYYHNPYANSSLSIEEWLAFMKSKCITIDFITNLNQNQKVKLLCIDRNFYDLIENNQYGVYSPEEFFAHNYIINYKHNHDLSGFANWNFDNNDEYSPFNFHLNYVNDSWYPLNNEGKLEFNEIEVKIFNIDVQNIEKKWQEYSGNTLVGWRGEMLLWDDAIQSPKINFNEGNYS